MTAASLIVARIHYPEWITAGAIVALVAGVAIALIGFWDARKTRHGQLITDLSRRWDEDSMIESLLLYPMNGSPKILALIERIYTLPPNQADLELYSKLQRLPSMIEAIGVLHSEGALSTGVVYKMWGPTIVGYWNAWREPVVAARENGEYRDAFKYFERLALIMGAAQAKEDAHDAKDAAKVARKSRQSGREGSV